MMKNRLRSMMLAIATLAIVLVNSIGLGAFDLVNARPKFPIEGNVIDIQTAPVIRQNYAVGFLYLAEYNYYKATDMIWNEGARVPVQQKIREAISGKQLPEGVRIYGEVINLKPYKLVEFSFSGNMGMIGVDVPVSIQFKTNNRSVFGRYADSTFRTKFNLQMMLVCHIKGDKIIVNDITAKMNVDSIDANERNAATFSSVDRFLKGQFQQDVESRNRTVAVKNQWAGYISSTIERLVPANILNQ
jgi:hypothetical protein